ncbi:TonB-dependent receptor [Tenacibaculum ovolyticum]|uniref:TonB-dependent receptor domain-containing protein n=1 Tax=Tenacibaculum ovolyticum TaxID=104270 RepID=UPI0022F402C9|nr:TonB-dependent receptor [Tenacibaculum ovolyticum]WBX78260.1 TonB-dependent receptor [Tenacibaculum ovolyticum]
MKSLIIFLGCLFLSISGFSQTIQKNGMIQGKIINTINETLPFASVILKDNNQKFIEGTVTDENGKFTFNKIAIGTYSIEVQYIGFLPFSTNITITKSKRKIDLKLIELKENVSKLEEVVVQGATTEVSLKLGKKVFRVGKDLSSQNGTATDILENVPSVNVSPTGVVSLRGNPNVQIMINGRRSALTQSQALEQLSADIIESVEVITNPSAKYDSSGSSGIINIILKKNRKQGLNGQVRLVSGIPDDFRALGNINYKANKFNFFTNLGLRYTDYEGTYTKQQTNTINGVTTFLNQNEDENRHDDGVLYYIGTDYSFNDKNTFTIAYYRNETKDTDVTYLDYDFSNEVTKTQSLLTTGNSKEKRDYNQIEANYTKLFETKGKRFTIDLQYDFWNSEKKWKLQTDETFPTTNPISTIQTRGTGETNDFAFQTDYKTPLSKTANLEIGAKFESRDIKNSFLAEELVNGTFETIENIDNTLNYKEKITSGYVQFNDKKNKFNYQFGVRLESTNVTIDASEAGLNSNKKYINLFPSATLGYEFKENTSGQLSYSKRIRRPSLWFLSPFYELKDFTSRFTGNPTLKPSYTDALEFSVMYSKNKLRLSPSVYYSNSTDIIQFETSKNDVGVFIQSPINLDKEERYGFELSASYAPLKWLRFSSDFNAYSYKQNGVINGVNANFSDATWFVNLTTNIKLSSSTKMQTRLYYQGERSNIQIRTKPITNLNFGISKSILKNKGSIIFNASNILNTRTDKQKIIGSTFKINQERSRNAQRFSLSFVYKFNQKPSDKNRKANRSNRN